MELAAELVQRVIAGMLKAALNGLGFGSLLDHEVTSYVKDNWLIRLLAEWTPTVTGFHLYYSSRRRIRPVLAAFIEAVRGRN